MSKEAKFKALASRAASGLAQIEAELRRTDKIDDSIGEQAEKYEQVLMDNLGKRRKGLIKAGDDAQAEYQYLTGHLGRSRIVAGMAREARRRR